MSQYLSPRAPQSEETILRRIVVLRQPLEGHQDQTPRAVDARARLPVTPDGVVQGKLSRCPTVCDEGMSGDERGDLVGGEPMHESFDQLQNGYLCSDSPPTSHDVESSDGAER